MLHRVLRRIGILLVLSMWSVLPAQASDRPVMVGYFPAFKGLARIATAPIAHYTHINIAFANPDAGGAIVRDDAMTCMPGGAGGNATVAELREAAARLRVKGAKVLLSVAGGVIPQCSGDWAALLASDKRETVKQELLSIVDAAGLDGIDIDIEGALLTAIDRAGNYTPFIAALSEGLKAKGKLLTVATASYEGGMVPVSSIPYFDLIMPMSYDAIGPSWGQAGSEHSTEAQAERDIALWLARGVRRERLVLGVPFYGYGFGKHAPGGDFRSLLAAHGESVLTADLIGKACAGCDYITFNSPRTLGRKAALARAKAGGVMVWEISQDTQDQLLGRTISEMLFASPN
ncbi:MAG: glycosyl hydrolase family 18 [Sphingomonadales bacterium]|nr:MAG: glycosyl hydrolase family 18 [Sphingomonadales bacterium]